ncbi:hypothetical protein H5399_17250 [Tessaracoccus sp. MC1627]|uniref:hypothetical protein n=1 Tax=Tessaracoccus sp. MC1627 TaxID=2760312 RepID=UPI001601B161|nr:hypothetical protein [Tessaracoccus sp. MC1627]MBB1514331.1 hypothetical protein [Tessaracoccus sp. MC1627]
MGWGVTAATALVSFGMFGFLVVGALAYAGRWARLRRRMIWDPEGHRLAGALWLSLLAVPIAVLILVDGPDAVLSVVFWVALGTMALLMVPMMALALNRPASLTRLFTPRWLLSERERLFGPLRPDGRPVHRPDPWLG